MWKPAAFGRLRVETLMATVLFGDYIPAAFGRLRVETLMATVLFGDYIPAAFGRLRVETVDFGILGRYLTASRLRAAAC